MSLRQVILRSKTVTIFHISFHVFHLSFAEIVGYCRKFRVRPLGCGFAVASLKLEL